MILFLLIVCSLSLSAGLEYRDEILTKNHLVILEDQTANFFQLSLDFKFAKYIYAIPQKNNTELIQHQVKLLKVKPMGSHICLYWLEHSQDKGLLHETKIFEQGPEDRVLITLPQIEYYDIHPTLDLIYITLHDGGLIEFNTKSLDSRQLLERESFFLVMLDAKNDNIYYSSCFDQKIIKFDIKNKGKEEFNMDQCYGHWVAAFEKNEIYATEFLTLYKISISNLKPFDENKSKFDKEIIHVFEDPVSSIALGPDYIYLTTYNTRF